MKKYIFLAVSALTLASCSSDDFLGDTPGNNPSYAQKAISFGGTTGKISRANDITGAEAAGKLVNNFIVFGTKTKDGQTHAIYNYYNVNWNTKEGAWVYAGEDKSPLNDLGGNQSLKYWDYSATSYDFVAFSLAGKSIDKGDGNGEIKITKITDSSNPTYTLTGNVSDLQSCYIADRISMTSGYGKPVKFTFHSTGTKVSVGIYEEIPGYSIKDIKFYESGTSETPSEKLVLYANDNLILASAARGSLTVSFDENNKAKAALSGETSTTTKSSKIEFTFNLDTEKQDHETEETTNKYLSRTSTKPTPSSTEGVLQCKITGGLNMKVDYTLIATDGSGEEIVVKGATVNIPEKYTVWQGNFHYNYKFKITENTNGSTGGENDPKGLYPITFAAVVTEDVTGSQTTETVFNDGTGDTTLEGGTTEESTNGEN